MLLSRPIIYRKHSCSCQRNTELQKAVFHDFTTYPSWTPKPKPNFKCATSTVWLCLWLVWVWGRWPCTCTGVEVRFEQFLPTVTVTRIKSKEFNKIAIPESKKHNVYVKHIHLPLFSGRLFRLCKDARSINFVKLQQWKHIMMQEQHGFVLLQCQGHMVLWWRKVSSHINHNIQY